MFLFGNTEIDVSGLPKKVCTEAVLWAVENLKRDMGFVLEESRACEDTEKGSERIWLVFKELDKECYEIQVSQDGLWILAGDELGFVYGIYEVSREILGVHDFWFWNDQRFVKKERIQVSEQFYRKSEPFRVKLRGWFINDEVLLSSWSVDRDPQKPWVMALEALMRCGGNMVIPGTDKNSRKYRELASRMGLFITHHHAEPLGAHMFARAYPGLNPSYKEHGDLFRGLWEEGIREQRGLKVVWNLGFRGQGDCPFWENDPDYATDEQRGKLMGSLIKEQYEMVKAQDPEAVCCTNLYGETMELYQKGCLKLPEDVIKIWADNGFGKMVSRRQENHNPRIPSLPPKSDEGCHGIYYHVSFYDLQAANHVTMLPNSPEFVCRELETVLDRRMNHYWLINCSNVKPHTFYLGLVARLWRGQPDLGAGGSHETGAEGEGTGSSLWKKYENDYVKDYMELGGPAAEVMAGCFDRYFQTAVAYGPNEDDHGGEQFCNHVTRILATQWIRDQNQPAKKLLWSGKGESLNQQVEWYGRLCRQGAEQYDKFVRGCQILAQSLPPLGEMVLRDGILLYGQIYQHCYAGAYEFCQGFWEWLEGNAPEAFYHVGKAAERYRKADQAMRDREHGKWNGFYANECLTDIKQTAWVLEGLMAWIRTLDDGPHYYRWQREFLYSEEDRRVMLIMNLENHLTDREIFTLMKEKWEG